MTAERIILTGVIMLVVACVTLFYAGIRRAQAGNSGTAMRTALHTGTPSEAGQPGAFSFEAPALLHRSDFPQPEAAWLLAIFTAKNCQTCNQVWQQQHSLRLPDTAITQVQHKKLLKRYGIEAVPVTVLADKTGKVRWSHLGRLNNSTMEALANLVSSSTG